MPRAKSAPERQKQIGSWGGRRKGAGRKRELTLSDRRKIASDYHARMQKIREGNTKASSFSPRRRRKDIIRELMAKYGATHRMIVRCLDDFLGKIKKNKNIWSYATKGDGIQPLPARNINKLKPGLYANKQLRLVVNSDGTRRWIYTFIWRFTVRDMVLGGSEISLATARERATNASRMVRRGQNPIDDLR